MTKDRIDTNIDKLDNGRFQVDLYLKNANTGQRERIRRTFTSLSAAKSFRRTKKAENQIGLWRQEPTEGITLEQAVELSKQEKISSFRKRNKGRDLGRQASPPTFDDMVRHMEEIEGYFGVQTSVGAITEDWIDEFTEHLMDRPKKGFHKGTLSNQSVDHVLKELRYLLRVAHKKGYLPKIPPISFVGNYGERDFQLDKGSFIAVVNALPSPPNPHRALLLMALNTGQRASDLTSMQWHQVGEDVVTYRSSKTQRENIKAPLMPITKEALRTLQQSKESRSEEIFINPRTGKPIRNIIKSLRTACRKAGVKPFTIHHIRHLATTILLECTNGDRDLVKRIIGWSNMDMVDRYGHIGSRAIPAFKRLNEQLSQINLDD